MIIFYFQNYYQKQKVLWNYYLKFRMIYKIIDYEYQKN